MTLFEIADKFPKEEDAIKYFEKARWGKNPIKCVYCHSTNVSKELHQKRHTCRNCGKSFSVTSHTQLDDTRMPLKKWMIAFAIISNAKKGVSSIQLSKDIGVQQRTAWAMHHKIRDFMSIENKQVNPLKDVVETDTKQIDVSMRKCETEDKGKHGRIPELDAEIKKYNSKGFKFKEGDYKKPCKTGNQKRGEGASGMKVAGAVQRDGNVIAHVIKNTSFPELKKLIDSAVNSSKNTTVLLSDEARSMRKFKGIINHIAINHFRLYSYRGLNTNTIESFWAIIERQIVGQHHHVDLKYLEKYVQETVFKWNNRKDDDMFETLVKISMSSTKIKKEVAHG